mgnify:CR=1 FL=1
MTNVRTQGLVPPQTQTRGPQAPAPTMGPMTRPAEGDTKDKVHRELRGKELAEQERMLAPRDTSPTPPGRKPPTRPAPPPPAPRLPENQPIARRP